MTPAPRAPRCADAAALRGDPRAGTAVPVTRWLLVEQPGPWGRDALVSSRLDAAVAAEVSRRAGAAGVRVLLVRRHGRAGQRIHGRRHWAVVDSRPGSEAIRWGRFEPDAQLLEVPLHGPVVPGPHAGPGDPARPVYLACTHGRHDTCCAVRGREVAAALDDLAPGRVWECSHVGGCRFAANVVVLPHGLYYGGVTPATAAALVEATEAGHVVPDLLRGRSSLPPEVQAAQHYARVTIAAAGTGGALAGVAGAGSALDAGAATGGALAGAVMSVDGLRPVSTRPRDDGSVSVGLEQAGLGRLQVSVRRLPVGPPALLTCAATRVSPPLGWEFVSLTQDPAGD